MTTNAAPPAPSRPRHMLLLLVDFLAVMAFVVGVFILSGMPVLIPLHIGSFRFDKLVHFGAYAVFGVLLCRFFFRLSGSLFWAVWLAAVLGGLYGLSDEIHQSFVPGRSAELYDLLADMLGAICGAFAWLAIQRRQRHMS